MAKSPDQITVKFRGGFKGPYIDFTVLVKNKVVLEVLDFTGKPSSVRDCQSFCYMQLRVNGKYCVTWQASSGLTAWLEDCKAEDEAVTAGFEERKASDGYNGSENLPDTELNFPVKNAVFYVGDDRAYYIRTAKDGDLVPNEEQFDSLLAESDRLKRRGRR